MKKIDQISSKRLTRLRQVANNRQEDLTIILENVHDPHNIGAVLRSADAVGVCEVYILQTEERLQKRHIKLGGKTTAGTRRWVQALYFTNLQECFDSVRKKYDRILTTHLYEGASTIHDVDLASRSTAIVFGNEHDGISREAINGSDGNIVIPQVGMVESLNISVACAVTLYEAYRQKNEKGHYSPDASTELRSEKQHIFDHYVDVHLNSKRSR